MEKKSQKIQKAAKEAREKYEDAKEIGENARAMTTKGIGMAQSLGVNVDCVPPSLGSFKSLMDVTMNSKSDAVSALEAFVIQSLE